jgi:hypothetical protein
MLPEAFKFLIALQKGLRLLHHPQCRTTALLVLKASDFR